MIGAANYVVWDCETGGLDFNENPITQFACCILDFKNLKEIDRWETFVKPYNDLKITQESLNLTMVSMSDINSGIDIKQFAKTFSVFMKSHNTKPKRPELGRLVPVGHNVQFDHGFLSYALNLEKLNLYDYIFPNSIDTQPLAKLTWGLTGVEKIKLTSCAEYSKIKLTDAHGAMNDVEATADLLRFYMKKLRSKKGDVSMSNEENGRKRGSEFFEFKCSKI